ncbi:hypothetical protein M2263_000122 [Providencia alcalifaciens]|nr:hypothetical protein [Providencia alcalifaciens]
MRITTTVKEEDDIELIDFCNARLIEFISSPYIDCSYAHKDMQAWIVRKKNGNISVKGYRT